MKTAQILQFKTIWGTTLIWDKRTRFRKRNLSRVVVMKLTIPKNLKKSSKKRQKWMRKRDKRNKMLQFLSLPMWTTLCAQFLPMLKCTSTIRSLQSKCTLCAQILQFQYLQGSQLWKERRFALQVVRIWRISSWIYGNASDWTFSHKNENAQYTRWLNVVGQIGGWLFLHFWNAITNYET